MKIDEKIYQNIKSCLKELSDIEFQKRVWLRGEGPEVSSYVEVVCQLFDDTGIGDQLSELEDGEILSQELDSALRELSILLDSIDYKAGVESILSHPKWPKTVKLASNALILIDKLELNWGDSKEVF